MPHTFKDWFKTIFVVFEFFFALCFGLIKSVLIGPIAALILILGNLCVILGLFPAHVVWTIFTIFKTHRFDAPLKVTILIALPALFGIWLGLSIAGSVLVGLGYGFFTPLVSSFEAFRFDDQSERFFHSVVDGTWDTIKGSCTVVRDFGDMCYHSYKLFLKEWVGTPCSDGRQQLRFIHVPGCIFAAIMGLLVEIPLYTAIAIVKSPLLLYKGWQRLIHDLISREGPFLESACIPIAGLTIIFWPVFVVGSIVMAIFSSIFIGLYASVVVYQERSFRRGVAYIIAMVAEFDEYTNDWLYLREGSILPKPRYRKKKASDTSESVGRNQSVKGRFSSVLAEAPGLLMPNLTSSRSVRVAIQEVKMMQVWGHMMRSCEIKGKELVDANVLTQADFIDWLKGKNSDEAMVVDVGLPCYAFLETVLYSIKSGSDGLMLFDNIEVTYLNRPRDKLLDWFFHPMMVLKDQIKSIKLEENETKFLGKVVLLGSNTQRIKAWENGCSPPQDPVRAAQIEGISRRMIGMIRSASMLPTVRRRYRQTVKTLLAYSLGQEGSSKFGSYSAARDGSNRSGSNTNLASVELV